MPKTSATPKGKPKKTKRTYSSRTIKILFGMSYNECAHADCTNRIIKDETPYSEALVVGQIAHIYAASDNGPRGKPDLTDKEKNHSDNLLLLCPTHHRVVDGQHETFPAVMLLKWKSAHQRKLQESLGATIKDVGFAELEIAAKAQMNKTPSQTDSSLTHISPDHKIAKNGLGATSAMVLRMGAAKSAEIEDLLIKCAQLDSGYPDRLREGFTAKYNAFFSEGLIADELFEAMFEWACGSTKNKLREAAGLCILTHLFIICDVFEK